MLTVLGGLTEVEHGFARKHAVEGRDRTKERGVRLGRKPILTACRQREAWAQLADGETQRCGARSYIIRQTSISRLHGA
jgi:DNA invertase Pin-like site-specific DNA recombinase